MSILTLSVAELASHLQNRRFISAELMYRPRPVDLRARAVFDFTLGTRLAELSRYERSAVVLICNDHVTVESLAHLAEVYPKVMVVATLVNPVPLDPTELDHYRDIPAKCNWESAGRWVRYQTTDRWARLLTAFEIGRQIRTPGYLLTPAHDAVWGTGLLDRLVRFGEHFARNGLPAAVSPNTYHQHSAVPGVAIPAEIIDGMNAAFGRDSWLRWRFRNERYQAIWGKMAVFPYELCRPILERVEPRGWEDDLEIDSAIRGAGYAARCMWVADPSLYRQSVPVYDEAGLRIVVERTLHYSVPIPGPFYAATSVLNLPLDRAGKLHRLIDPRFARAVALSESLIAACTREIADRIDRLGMTWVDWGAYRHVVRVGDPFVQVWKYEQAVV